LASKRKRKAACADDKASKKKSKVNLPVAETTPSAE